MADLTCPGCARPMREDALQRTPLAPLAIDVCDDCQALWFDADESQQLTPGAVIELFRVIGSSQPARRDAYPALMPCPRCTTPLTLTRDVQHTTRFTYYRCRYRHGRFTPYVQFLLEKNFIRPLDPAELGRLRAIVATVRCSSCGAPVPLDQSPVCPYCGAPVMLLDPQTIEKALDRLHDAEVSRTTARPPSGDALIAIANVERELAQSGRDFEGESGIDLVAVGLRALRSLLGH